MNKAKPIHNRILVMRFSAMGDVAMTVPVVKAFLASHPEKEILMVSQQSFSAMFLGIDRLEFFGVNLKGKHKGLLGIFRLWFQIRKEKKFDAIADLHGVLRSHILHFLFRLDGKKTSVIDKGRKAKKELTRKKDKVFTPLQHSTERYADVFKGLGMPISQGFISNAVKPAEVLEDRKIHLGFAPFAKHLMKMYDLDRFKEIIRFFDKEPFRLHLFGGSVPEKLIIREWEQEFKMAIPQDPSNTLASEIELMGRLDLMVSMDSANMHLASLKGTPVISIWGPTHPYAGFMGVGQSPLNAIQANMDCRPCSVFGNKNCWKGDHACMAIISPANVIERVLELVGE